MPSIFWLITSFLTFIISINNFRQGSDLDGRFLFNLSPLRFSIVLFFLILSIISLIFFGISQKNKGIFPAVLNNYLKVKPIRIAIVALINFVSFFVFYVISRNPVYYGDIYPFFQRIIPSLFFIAIILLLTSFFIEIRSLEYIKNIMKKCYYFFINPSFIQISILFLVIVFIKLLFIVKSVYGPTIPGDEVIYYRIAHDLFYQRFTAEYNHYPFLYPIVLSISFFGGKNVYDWIKIINVLLSSSIVFPVYLMSRQYLDHRKSLIIASLCVLTPFHIVFPRQIMSENLFFPLFLWAIYFISHNPNENPRLSRDIITGVLLGAMYLTRYISLVIIPFLLVAWWVRPFDRDDKIFHPSRKKLLHFSSMFLIMCATFGLWLIYGLRDHIPLKLMIGFGQYGEPEPGQTTLENLIKWIYLYGCYIILISAPVLNLLIVGIRQFDLKKFRTGYQHLIFTLLAATGSIFIAVVRHSWRAAYNNLIPAKIMGRYLVYFSAFFFIMAMINLIHFDRSKYKNIWHFLIETILLPVFLVTISYLTLIPRSIIPIGENIIKLQGSVDVFFIQSLSLYFFPIIIFLYFVTNLLLWYNKKSQAFLFLIMGLTGYFLVGSPIYLKELKEEQLYPQLGVEILNIINQEAGYPKKLPEFVVIMPSELKSGYVSRVKDSMEVHGKGNPLVMYDEAGILTPTEKEGFTSVLYNSLYPPILQDNRFIFYVDEMVDAHPYSSQEFYVRIQNKEFFISTQP